MKIANEKYVFVIFFQFCEAYAMYLVYQYLKYDVLILSQSKQNIDLPGINNFETENYFFIPKQISVYQIQKISIPISNGKIHTCKYLHGKCLSEKNRASIQIYNSKTPNWGNCELRFGNSCINF